MLSIRLFGKLSVQRNSADLESLRFGKLAELLCYLLVRREHSHSREVLGSLLWGDSTTARSRKYLRQALWQLQTILRNGSDGPVFLIDRNSVRIRVESGVWADVAVFESACLPLQQTPPSKLRELQAQSLKAAVELYRGDLLEGWYQDWCLFERERLQNLYLLTLEKLMSYSEEQRQYTMGLEMGERILRVDRAHERAYQSMMRMHYLADDRAGALRQYQRCESALREELGVTPAKSTVTLLAQIRADHIPLMAVHTADNQPDVAGNPATADRGPALASWLRQLSSLLSDMQRRIETEVEAIDQLQSDHNQRQRLANASQCQSPRRRALRQVPLQKRAC